MTDIYKKPIIIAEIGCNHKGNINIAKRMIDCVSELGIQYVKFQKRDNKYLLKDKYNDLHPNYNHSYGNTYGKHREFLEFNIKQHEDLYKYCIKKKIKYSVSVWEKKSALDIINSKIVLDYIKVPSACNLDFDLLYIIAKNFKKKIHISLGMTSYIEIKKIYNVFKKNNRQKDLVFYAWTSEYPAKFKNLCLLEIKKIIKNYKKRIFNIGFSGHHLGIAMDIAAYTLGANYLERHFTLDRTWKGTDHAASLEPNGLKKLVRDINNVYSSMKYKNLNGILKDEYYQRRKLKVLL